MISNSAKFESLLMFFQVKQTQKKYKICSDWTDKEIFWAEAKLM